MNRSAGEHQTAPYIYQRQVRWNETDVAGIVYTPHFLHYAMEAIEAWCTDVLGTGWYQLTADHGLGNPVVHCELDFSAPLSPRNMLHAEVRIEKIGRSSVHYVVRGYRDADTLSFTARIVAAWVTVTEMRPIAIPAQYRERIERYIDRCAAVG